MKNSLVRFVLSLTVGLCLLGVTQVQAGGRVNLPKSELEERIHNAEGLLQTFMETPGYEIPTPIIAKSKAVIFVEQFQAGLALGVKSGYCIAMLHDGKGGWSPPAFYSLGGTTLGLQFGTERRQSILFIMDEEATRMLTGDTGEVGVDAGVSAGPRGANADYSNVTRFPVLDYTLASGVYAGATMQSCVFSPNNVHNTTFYGVPVEAIDVLESRVAMPNSSKNLAKLLNRYVKEGQRKALTDTKAKN